MRRVSSPTLASDSRVLLLSTISSKGPAAAPPGEFAEVLEIRAAVWPSASRTVTAEERVEVLAVVA
jgi:hypothetical protein